MATMEADIGAVGESALTVPELRALHDEELVRRIQDGDAESFNILVEAYLPSTYKKVRRLVPLEDAEDVTQDIFLNLVGSIGNFQGRAAFATWFNKIVMNRVADHHRHEFRRKGRFVSEDEVQIRDEPAEGPDERFITENLLANLPEHYRGVILMKLFDNLSFAEIASDLNMTYEAVRSRYRRALVCAGEKIDEESLRSHN